MHHRVILDRDISPYCNSNTSPQSCPKGSQSKSKTRSAKLLSSSSDVHGPQPSSQSESQPYPYPNLAFQAAADIFSLNGPSSTISTVHCAYHAPNNSDGSLDPQCNPQRSLKPSLHAAYLQPHDQPLSSMIRVKQGRGFASGWV